MSFYSICIIAVALSLDAVGVSLCIGLNNHAKFKNKLAFATAFGFFQRTPTTWGSVITRRPTGKGGALSPPTWKS